MHDYGIWSLIPPLLTVILAIATRQVIVSLLTGTILGFLVLQDFHLGAGLAASVQGLIDVFKSDSSAKVLIFIVMVGGIIHLSRITRGMEGLILLLTERTKVVRGPVSTQLLGICLTALIFVESNISLLTSGIVTQSLGSRHRVSREQLAYVIRNTGLTVWSSVLINGWGAAMMAVIATQIEAGVISGNSFWILASSIKYNIFAWVIFAFVLASVLSRFGFPYMRKANERAAAGIELRQGAKPLIDDSEPDYRDCKPCPLNLIIPLLAMIVTVPIGLYVTGNGNFSAGSGSTAVLWGVMVGQLTGAILYIGVRRTFSVNEYFHELLEGYKTMVPLAVIMVLAFLIGNVAADLNVGGYVATLVDGLISPNMTAALVFAVACIISLSTGTSWGTFAIMIPIGIQLAVAMGANPYLVIGAAISGSIFGDGVSPISDTGIVAAMATRGDLMDHVNSQLPYEFTAGFISLGLFVLLGMTV